MFTQPSRFKTTMSLLCMIVAILSLPSRLFAQSSPSLPLTSVILYSSGVGYFQHDGSVEGDTRVSFKVPLPHMNDLLKSLVVQDFDGGNVTSMLYGSRDPLGKTLGRLAIDLSHHPNLSQILRQIRGESVEISTASLFTGTIVGVEQKTEYLGDTTPPKVVTVDYLTLLTPKGLQRIPLSQIQHIRLLNDALNRELLQALSTIADNHDHEKRTIAISFQGTGKRNVRMAYLHETPVWKTAYRLVMNDQGNPYVQGWAIVENTSDQDWKDVNLSFIAGRPISFIMDLYQPLYLERPVVTPNLHSQLAPQTYEGTVDQMEEQEARSGKSFVGKDEGKRQVGRGQKHKRSRELADAGPAMTLGAQAPQRLNLHQGFQAQAQGEESGELFRYRMSTPLTIPQHSSAMVPILNEYLEGEKVSIYNQSVHAKHPLYGFRLHNTSSLHLMQGPITIFEENAYAGDAQILDLAPQETRLISYALDGTTEVVPIVKSRPQEFVSVVIKKGTLRIKKQYHRESTYRIHNRDTKSKTLLIEHPTHSDWTLANPPTSMERTRSRYRFPLTIDAHQNRTLTVQEVKPLHETIHLLNSRLNRIELIVKAPVLSPHVKQALENVVQRRTKLEETVRTRTGLETRTQELTKEQERIRKNMQRLAHTSPLYKRYVKKLDQQENTFEGIRTRIEALKEEEARQRTALEQYLLNLNVG